MTKQKRKWVFPVALLIYALVFLCAMAIGLSWFWNFIDAYEDSRPKNTLNAYMEKLSAEYVADRCDELIATIDHNVQSEQECREAIIAALDGKFSCAKKNKESSDDHYVYALRCGAKVIGMVEMKSVGQEAYGFTPWEITAESFDLSYLLTSGASITVPKEYPVYANGRQLGDAYITQADIPYSLLEAYYDSYTLPSIVTYTVGPSLGEIELTATDPVGNPVTVDENTDYNAFLDNCSAEEKTDLDSIVGNYVKHYVYLTTRKGGSLTANYNNLVPYMVPNGSLATHIKNSLNGLSWISDRKATVKKVTVNAYVNVGEGRYMCDVTVIVNQMIKQSGAMGDVTNNFKLMIYKTNAGLKVEAMKSY